MENWNALDEYEEWRDIPGYVGLYQASSHGRVRSVARLLQSSIDEGLRIHKTLLKPGTNKQGRLGVILSKPVWLSETPGIKRYQVHRLVYAAFHGEIPEGAHVLHKDGNHLDNAITNLYLGNHLQNMRDKRRHGTQTEGEDHPASKLDEDAVIRIRYGNEKQKVLAKEYGISQAAVSHIRNFKTWKHLTRQLIPAPSLFDDQE
jgi:hypothetical protein